MDLVDHLKNTIVEELNHLNGSDFEQLCHHFIEMVTDKDFALKGHNLEMKPVRGSVDLVEDDGYRIIGQCGTDNDYFSGNKPVKDVDGSIKNSPDFTTIYLFSNRRAKGNEYQTVVKTVNDKLKSINKTGYHIHIFDSQRIAEKIYDNIYKTVKVKKVLSFLPKSYEYYILLPQPGSLPLQKPGYKHRPEEETIIERLKVQSFIQIYGLSGIGKTQMSIALANKINSNDYNAVLWIEGKDIQSPSFENVYFRRMNENINLSYILNTFTVLLVIDNLNENVQDVLNSFSQNNQKGSKCIVSSLSRSISPKNTFELSFVSDDISKEILNDCKIPPTESQLTSIVSNISGYPLLLELCKNAVSNNEMSWNDIVGESDLSDFPDDTKGELFAQRIVGRYKQDYLELFNLIIGLDSTTLSKLFLKEKNSKKLLTLFRSAMLQDEGLYLCRIHQVVLDAIRNVVGNNYSDVDFRDYIQQYLEKHISNRDEWLYTFIANHKDKLLEMSYGLDASHPLRHYIVLSYLYSVDTYNCPSRYIDFIKELLLFPDQNEIDLRLYIERMELDQRIIQNGAGEDITAKDALLKDKVNSDINSVKEFNISSSSCKALLNHHIGKWLSTIKEFEAAEPYLHESLKLNPKSYHSMLRLARNYSKQGYFDKAAKQIEKILNEETIKEVPISVRLAAYDIISNYNYKEQRKRFIDSQFEQFSNDIYASLSESYSHTYIVLSKLAGHLSYNYPEEYSRLCDQLPLPLDIEHNMRIRKDYGKIKQAQYVYGNYSSDYKDKLFDIAFRYLSSIPNKDEFLLKDMIKLLLSAGRPYEALNVAEEIKNREDKFIQQILCKIYYANGEYDLALDYIEKAISKEKPEQKEYCAAFRHDKALCLYQLKSPKAESTMIEAIQLQPNNKTKGEWEKELKEWTPN